MKKGCLIALAVVGGLAVLGAIAVVVVFGLTRGATKAGDDFLALTSSGKIREAYESSATTLKTQQSFEAFERAVQRLGLSEVTSASWSQRELKNDRVHLDGSGRTRSGGKVPLTMDLIKEGGAWKVLAVNVPASGVAASSGETKMPPDTELRALALDSLLAFNDAVQTNDFTRFHQQISAAWQEQITPAKLAEVFHDFVVKQINIAGIKNVQPIFNEPPQVDSNGLLVISGYYPTKPARVVFRLKYIYEHPNWKLFGIKVNTGE
jgi:hypothetical protein